MDGLSARALRLLPCRPEVTLAGRSLLLTLGAYACLTQALLLRNAHYSAGGLALVLVALALLLAGWRRSADASPRVRSWALLALLGWQLACYVSIPPAPILKVPDYEGGVFAAAAGVAGLVAVLSLTNTIRPGRWALLAVLAAAGAGAAYMLQIAHSNHIDVHMFLQEGASTFCQGENPYLRSYPDIYGGQAPFEVFTEHYPYPPQMLLLSALPWALGGDVRWGSVFGLLLTGAAAYRLARLRWPQPEDPTPLLLATLLVFHPRNLIVLERGFNEFFLLALLAWTVYAAARGATNSSGVLVALALGVKQYTVVLILPLLLLRPSRRALLIALASGLAVLLPFAVWSTPAELARDLGMQSAHPLRADSLTLLAALHRLGWDVPVRIGVLAAFLAGGAALWLSKRSPADALRASAVALLALFVFGPKGHVNYYLAVALLTLLACCAPERTEGAPDQPQESSKE